MQRDHQKLREARYRLWIGKSLLFVMLPFLANYAMFLASGGARYFFGIGHWSPLIAFVLVVLAFIVMKPIFRLEEPFQYELSQKRKAEKRAGEVR